MQLAPLNLNLYAGEIVGNNYGVLHLVEDVVCHDTTLDIDILADDYGIVARQRVQIGDAMVYGRGMFVVALARSDAYAH